MDDDGRLDGGFDNGAELEAGSVRRAWGSWTEATQDLLRHLELRGFDGAPRPLGRDSSGREVLTYLVGETVGHRRPWPAWVHTDDALVQVAHWLRDFHAAVADFVPRDDAAWREGHEWRPGLVIAHNDAAPYNAVWDDRGLVGFVDWDMAGPSTVITDLAWMAFAWVPVHARAVVAAEGFTDFDGRGRRLRVFLDSYGWPGTRGEVVDALRSRLGQQVADLYRLAADGDATYRRMLDASVAGGLLDARPGLDDL